MPPLLVADFLKLDGSWKDALINQYFEPQEAQLICQIRTSQRNESDFIAWYPEKRGLFTVKSAYDLAINLK
jgi:hypothetical protein